MHQHRVTLGRRQRTGGPSLCKTVGTRHTDLAKARSPCNQHAISQGAERSSTVLRGESNWLVTPTYRLIHAASQADSASSILVTRSNSKPDPRPAGLGFRDTGVARDPSGAPSALRPICSGICSRGLSIIPAGVLRVRQRPARCPTDAAGDWSATRSRSCSSFWAFRCRPSASCAGRPAAPTGGRREIWALEQRAHVLLAADRAPDLRRGHLAAGHLHDGLPRGEPGAVLVDVRPSQPA